MAFEYNHDMHIHTRLSPCSGDDGQTCERILDYAVQNGLDTVAVTDHFWDSAVAGASSWYKPLNYEHVSRSLPLPKNDTVRFLFGCETDMDMQGNIGLTKENFSLFDFVIVSTTHFHMEGFTVPAGITQKERALIYVKRLHSFLNSDIPFKKTGIAHLTCNLIDNSEKFAHIDVVDMVSDKEFYEIFGGVAACGAGVELNIYPRWYDEDQLKRVLRPYMIARDCGCKFYLGSDSHHGTNLLNAPAKLKGILGVFPLEATDRFTVK